MSSKDFAHLFHRLKKKLDNILGSDSLLRKIDEAASLKIGKHVLLSLLIYLVYVSDVTIKQFLNKPLFIKFIAVVSAYGNAEHPWIRSSTKHSLFKFNSLCNRHPAAGIVDTGDWETNIKLSTFSSTFFNSCFFLETLNHRGQKCENCYQESRNMHENLIASFNVGSRFFRT